MFLTVLLVAVVGALYWFYRKRCANVDRFERLGIPGPKPHWLFGNYGQYRKQFPFQALQRLTKQYGKIYGIHEGPLPIIVTSDLDLLQEVFIKQFSKFHGRKNFPLDDPDAPDVMMLSAWGHRWKRLRTIVNPTFSMSKLKQMVPDMNGAVSILVKNLRDKASKGEAFDIYNYYQRCTLEVIGQCALGLSTHAQEDDDDTFLSKCRVLFRAEMSTRWVYVLGAVVPELNPLLRKLLGCIFRVISHPWLHLHAAMTAAIDHRRSPAAEKRMDLLQLLLDAEDDSFSHNQQVDMWTMSDSAQIEEEAPEPATTHANEVKDKDTKKPNKKVLTKEETCSQGLLFLLAGYETTSTTLAYVTYLLAKNPDVQEKLIQEVDACVTDELTYKEVQKMDYLHMVIEETLRLYPVASGIVARRSMEPCSIRDYQLDRDVIIQADVWSIHRDPDLWPKPEVFNPERFSAEHKATRHPMAWLGFGAGPRNCVGLRFAMLEAKIAICRLLKEFRIHACAQTPDELTLSETSTIVPVGGVFVKLSLRGDA